MENKEVEEKSPVVKDEAKERTEIQIVENNNDITEKTPNIVTKEQVYNEDDTYSNGNRNYNNPDTAYENVPSSIAV